MSHPSDDLVNDGALALLALKSAPTSPTGFHQWDRNQVDSPVIAKVSTKGVEVYMRRFANADQEGRNPQIIVGRRHNPIPGLTLTASPSDDSEPVTVDLELGQNNYVSRQHLKIYYETFEDKFFMRCLGKNGILVDDMLVRKNADPVELPEKCVMRFPSTQIKLLFEAIIRKTQEQSSESPEVGEDQGPVSVITPQQLAFRMDSNAGGVNNFSSPCPSPTGTISAVNSCPTSPRHAGGALPADNDFQKPPFSYAQLIVQAISSVPDRQMTLSGIYSYIQKNYPYYRTADRGWQNSIRHNLSLNRYFLKVPRNHDEPGKGSYWRIEPQSENKLCEQAFRKRRHRTITAVRSPQAFRSAPSSPTHNAAKEPSPIHSQGDFDFGDSAPNSPSRSEPGSASSTSMPNTPSSAAQPNGFVFPHPAFAQFKPNPAALRSFPGFFFAQTGQLPPGMPPGSPTYFIPNMDSYQMPPPNAFKRPSPTSDEDDGHSGNGKDREHGNTKKMKIDSEEESNHSNSDSMKESEAVENGAAVE